MGWLAVTGEVPADAVDAFGDALLERGALSVDLADAHAGTVAESALFDEPGVAAQVWRANRICALFPAETDPAAVWTGACADAGLGAQPFSVQGIDEQDWVRRTRDQFQPIQISPRLWIVPTWAELPDPQAINLQLDPGLAFGTGAHPTTRLCLRWLEQNLRAGDTVLDYGCGSGILAIAAMKLGAAAASGIDIDPQAVLAAGNNAMQNQVAVRFELPHAGRGEPVQVVLANILANPLKVLAPLLAGLTLPRGRIALSGILAQQADEIAAIYAQWFDLQPAMADEGWVLLSGTRAR